MLLGDGPPSSDDCTYQQVFPSPIRVVSPGKVGCNSIYARQMKSLHDSSGFE